MRHVFYVPLPASLHSQANELELRVKGSFAEDKWCVKLVHKETGIKEKFIKAGLMSCREKGPVCYSPLDGQWFFPTTPMCNLVKGCIMGLDDAEREKYSGLFRKFLGHAPRARRSALVLAHQL